MTKQEILKEMVIVFDIIQKITEETDGQNEKLTNLLRQAELGIYNSVYVIEDELLIE